MNYKISGYYPAKASFEITVNVNGLSFQVIYGTHRDGGFCAIPNHGISCEMASTDDLFFNTEALLHRDMSKPGAKAIAYAIRDAAAANEGMIHE